MNKQGGMMKIDGVTVEESVAMPMDITDEAVASLRVHQCCVCCCDFRKAVIIIDSVMMVLGFVGACVALSSEEHRRYMAKPNDPRSPEDFPDDEWSNFVEDSAAFKFIIARGFVDLLFYGCSIVGALKFRWKLLVPLVVWSIVAESVYVVLKKRLCDDWESTETGKEFQDEIDCRSPMGIWALVFFLYILIFLYPHLTLAWQYQRKRVTKESYPHQKKCCALKRAIILP